MLTHLAAAQVLTEILDQDERPARLALVLAHEVVHLARHGSIARGAAALGFWIDLVVSPYRVLGCRRKPAAGT